MPGFPPGPEVGVLVVSGNRPARGRQDRRPRRGPAVGVMPRPAWDGADVAGLSAMMDEELSGALRGSAMRRTKVSGMRRNLQVATENLGEVGK